MDKKSLLRNFRQKMTSSFGNTAEDLINQKVLKLMNSDRLDEKELNIVENDIKHALENRSNHCKRIS